MAFSYYFLISNIVLFFFFTNGTQQIPKPGGVVFAIQKDKQSLQYYTMIEMGNHGPVLKLVLDLDANSVWIDCDKYQSSSFRPIYCGTAECKALNPQYCLDCGLPYHPGCSNNTCGSDVYNPFVRLFKDGNFGLRDYGTFGVDTMKINNTHGYKASQMTISCGRHTFVRGLATGANGIVGLDKSSTSLHKQVSSAMKLPQKFAICLHPFNERESGALFIGGGPYYIKRRSGKNHSDSLVSIPIITDPKHDNEHMLPTNGYFIDVKSIKVNGKAVSFNTSLLAINPENGDGGTKISTAAPYTALHRSIYKAVINVFVKNLISGKTKQVKSVKPFGACFNSRTIASTETGSKVPTIDLVFQGKGQVFWRIYGHHSMVKVSKDVMCLGIVDGGVSPRTSIVLGGHQIENHLIEFDLVSSNVRFSNLLLQNSSCSHVRLAY